MAMRGCGTLGEVDYPEVVQATTTALATGCAVGVFLALGSETLWIRSKRRRNAKEVKLRPHDLVDRSACIDKKKSWGWSFLLVGFLLLVTGSVLLPVGLNNATDALRHCSVENYCSDVTGGLLCVTCHLVGCAIQSILSDCVLTDPNTACFCTDGSRFGWACYDADMTKNPDWVKGIVEASLGAAFLIGGMALMVAALVRCARFTPCTIQEEDADIASNDTVHEQDQSQTYVLLSDR